jgi:hypothetical protein
VCYFGFSRYADDLIVIAADRDRLEQVLPSIRHFLAERGLDLNEDKTRIVDAYDGFDFLGFHHPQVSPWQMPGKAPEDQGACHIAGMEALAPSARQHQTRQRAHAPQPEGRWLG